MNKYCKRKLRIKSITKQMAKAFTLFLFILIHGVTNGQNQLTLFQFVTFCDSVGLTFKMPEGYKIIDIKENPDLQYSFAIVNEDSSMEIRYSIWSLKSAMIEYQESLKNDNSMMVSPNKMYKGIIQSNVLNMTDGQGSNIGEFSSQAVNNEFNADAGGSSFFKFDCEFGTGYAYGQSMYIHKDNIADVIVTFMSNNKETHSNLMMVGFHSLKFKPENMGAITETKLHNGIKLVIIENEIFVTDENSFKIIPFDSKNFITEDIINQIRLTELKDNKLIARVLEMYSEESQINEMMNLAITNDEFATFILNYISRELDNEKRGN